MDAIISAGEVFGLSVDASAGRFLESRGFGGDGFQESLQMLFRIVRGRDVFFLDRPREFGVFGLDGFPEVGEFLGDGDLEFRSVAVAVFVVVIFTGEAERREGEGGDGCEQGWCFGFHGLVWVVIKQRRLPRRKAGERVAQNEHRWSPRRRGP